MAFFCTNFVFESTFEGLFFQKNHVSYKNTYIAEVSGAWMIWNGTKDQKGEAKKWKSVLWVLKSVGSNAWFLGLTRVCWESVKSKKVKCEFEIVTVKLKAIFVIFILNIFCGQNNWGSISK